MRRRFSLLLLAVLTLGSSAGALRGARARGYEARQLKKQHKAERKELKQQRRVTKKVMDQHGVSDDQRKRVNNDMKRQEQLLNKSQKDASRKQGHKAAKAASQAA